jgi:hypothetical protein
MSVDPRVYLATVARQPRKQFVARLHMSDYLELNSARKLMHLTWPQFFHYLSLLMKTEQRELDGHA